MAHKRLIQIGKPLAFLSILGGLLIAPGMATAGSKGRRNTTIGLGAATIHQAVTGKKRNALILGAGTVYAYTRYNSARKAEKRRQRAAAARRYRNNASYSRSRYTTSTYSSRSRYGGASSAPSSAARRHYHTNRNGKRVYHSHTARLGHRH